MITIELEGVPLGKGRPRFTSWGGSKYAYTPVRTAAYEQALGYMALQAMRGKKPLTEAVRVVVRAFMPIPKSWPLSERKRAIVNAIRPTGKPDCDNILKMLDALNKIVWLDDAQIVSAEIHKIYSSRPHLVIEVGRIV
jgi:Holliday junction resolvase RusA-like endonuclease